MNTEEAVRYIVKESQSKISKCQGRHIYIYISSFYFV